MEQLETVYLYNADGTGERDFHIKVKVQNEAGARQLGVLSFPYTAANESAQIKSLVVHHPDGTSAETPSTDAMDMPAPVTQQAPLYSDLKILQIPVRGLRTGDTLDFRVQSMRKNPESPSQFWGSFSFTKGLVVLAETLTLNLPDGRFVQVWGPKFKPTETDTAGRHIYVWTSSQLTPTSSGKKKDDDTPAPKAETKPDVAWTTFHTWQEVGEWYRDLSTSAKAGNDALRAQADEITREAKSPEEQIQALYSFVSSRIRYVGIDFGVGRYRPHAAAEVAANRYGDCKDKDTLLEALLRAKGFATGSALIGVNLDIVPEHPSPVFFNHVITTVELPSGKLWMDTTPGVAPFQLLLAPMRDKDALVIPAAGNSRLELTPALPPFPFFDRLEADATLKSDGELTGKVNIDLRSDNEILARAIAQNLAPAQWDQGTQLLANSFGFSGTTSNSAFARPDDIGVPMHVSYDYSKKPFGDWDNYRIIPLFPVNTLPAAPDKKPADEIDLGAVRTESAASHIHLPEGFGADLPDGVHAKTPFATFDKIYKLANGELISERKIVVLQSKLPADSWEQYKKFAKDISLGEEGWIQLTTTAPLAKGPHPPKPGENNPEAAQLVADATALERRQDWDGALKKLDEAKALQPKQPFLWSNYGYIAMIRGKNDEAKEHFRHELALYPDETYVVTLFAGLLQSRGETEEAMKVLSSYFQIDPANPGVAQMLASIEAKTKISDAITTLRRAAEAVPSNQGIQSMLGECLVRDNKKPEAADIAKKLLDGAEDNSGRLNDASYLLAEADGDLAFAEQKSRKSIAMAEGETAADIGEANEQSFGRTLSLVAYWDTLGYILMKEKKLDEARDYLEAAWRNHPDSEVGSHYGQVLEALGKSSDALDIYEESRSGSHRPPSVLPALQPLEASIACLRKAGVSSKLKTGAELALQNDRTLKIKLKAASKSYMSAIFRLQLGAGSMQGVLRVSGDSVPDGVLDSIKNLTLPHLVPAHSSGRILRDAVLTCSPNQTDCFLVLMPMGTISNENVSR